MGPRIMLPNWRIGTADEAARMQAERDRILASRFFLVRIRGNSGMGDVLRCRGCGGRHQYLTLACISQPFSGLTGGLFAYYHTLGVSGAVEALSPAQRARVQHIARVLNGQPDLASSHPRTARGIATAERDMDLGAVSLGVLEPVSRAEARRLVQRINGTGLQPPLILPGLEVT
jgi:hypothetical protein